MTTTPAPGEPIGRDEVLRRARHWVDREVPYSMEAYAPDPEGREYRTDCSGLVSMAWCLADSLDTETLPPVCTAIAWHDLRPGDVVGTLGPGTEGAAGHVVLFVGWADREHTRMNVVEQRGGAGAIAAVRDREFSVAGREAAPFRYLLVRD